LGLENNTINFGCAKRVDRVKRMGRNGQKEGK